MSCRQGADPFSKEPRPEGRGSLLLHESHHEKGSCSPVRHWRSMCYAVCGDLGVHRGASASS